VIKITQTKMTSPNSSVANAAEQLDESEETPTVFDASLHFSHTPPFAPVFAERVPLVYAFKLAVQAFQYSQQLRSNWKFDLQRTLGIKPVEKFVAAECGVYTGSSLMVCSKILRDFNIPFEFFGLDTFSGLPALSEQDKLHAPPKARYRNQPMFTDTSFEKVQREFDQEGFNNSVFLKQGLFSNSLPTLEDRKYHWLNIDCDLFEPHQECLEYFYLKVVKGGVVFFDDYHSIDYPMAKIAIDSFLADKPECLMHLRFDKEGPNKVKAFFVKL
jgi:O-methyltransferase